MGLRGNDNRGITISNRTNMTNNKQQTAINAVEYLDKVNQFAKENNTDKPRQQTALEWLQNEIWEHIEWKPQLEKRAIVMKFEQAKEMEWEQINNAYLQGFNDNDCNPHEDTFNLYYYNETYEGGEQ